MVFVVAITMTTPASATGNLVGVVVDAASGYSGVQARSSDCKDVGEEQGDSGGPKMVQVFWHQSGYRGPITITVEGYNESDYRTSILVYSPDGLILRDENWLPYGNRKIVNGTGSDRVQAIYLGIYPKPAVFFRPAWQTFPVHIEW